MPNRLPERTRNTTKKKPREKRTRKYESMSFQEVPVNSVRENEMIIDGIDSKCDGIRRGHSFLAFAPKLKVGEHLKIKIASVGRKFAIAGKIK